MENSDDVQNAHEAWMFQEMRTGLRNKRNHALERWAEIRRRYVYQGRQYEPHEIIEWFMNAPFQEVAGVSKELGVDWKTIASDVEWMADPPRAFDKKEGGSSDTSDSFPGCAGIYAAPRVIEDIQQCYFYHTIDLPGHGTMEGDWDLRRGIRDYLGRVDFTGKRVLDIGTANGMISFEIEKLGGQVTTFDLSKEYSWDLVPYARGRRNADMVYEHRQHIDMLNNAYWFGHRLLHSNARAVYGDVYHIPEQIGEVDIVIYGSILLHLRDPFLALQGGARVAREAIVVTEVHGRRAFRSKAAHMRFLPNPQKLEPLDTWWELRPELVVRMIKVLGFDNVRVTYHSQLRKGRKIRLYTVVGRRTP